VSVDWLTVQGVISIGLLLIQVPAAALLLSRLVKGRTRRPPIEPQAATPDLLGAVSVVVPTLNEAERIAPCLTGLSRQGYEVREIIVVDSRSQDGTPELVKAAQQKDPRFRLMTDEPLPAGWVGRPWALHHGFLSSSEQSQWILGIDADTQPSPGLVAGLLQVAEAEKYDLVSLSPRFILKYPGEWWLQPSLLLTLVYRFGAAGDTTQTAERVMANGQCFLCRRSVLAHLGGYSSAKASFCDDVTLARNAAAAGFKVGFLDGAKVLKVRMYEGAKETWKEWGRSLDLKDASKRSQIWGDLWLLLAIQGLPLPTALTLATWHFSPPVVAALSLNSFLLAIRLALLLAIAPSYDRTATSGAWLFWFSPLADPLAFVRILLSSLQTPTQWRGRSYGQAK
jgi:dolichol-phosphate mannosyltransferase